MANETSLVPDDGTDRDGEELLLREIVLTARGHALQLVSPHVIDVPEEVRIAIECELADDQSRATFDLAPTSVISRFVRANATKIPRVTRVFSASMIVEEARDDLLRIGTEVNLDLLGIFETRLREELVLDGE